MSVFLTTSYSKLKNTNIREYTNQIVFMFGHVDMRILTRELSCVYVCVYYILPYNVAFILSS